MALIIKTDKPLNLLTAIKKAIDDKLIETWSYDTDGDFTHTAEQWKFKAWMRPKIYNGEIRFGILGPENTTMTNVIYGIYHGRFSEMLLIHFDTMYTNIIVTANKTEPDNFNVGS